MASGDDEESRNDSLRLKANTFERNGDAVAIAAVYDLNDLIPQP